MPYCKPRRAVNAFYPCLSFFALFIYPINSARATDPKAVPAATGEQFDCNNNEIADNLDIASGFSLDDNDNGIPDECNVIFYIDGDAPPSGDGVSWAGARQSVDPIDFVIPDGFELEIRVAEGTYPPPPDSPRRIVVDRNITLRGGYAGYDSPDPEFRDPKSFRTVLYGGVTVLASSTGSTIDGFTITRDGASIIGGTVTFLDCLIANNWGGPGGGMFIGSNANVTIDRCKISENVTRRGRDAHCDHVGTEIYVTDGYPGGGIYIASSTVTITNSVFALNRTGNGGDDFNCFVGSRCGGIGAALAATDSDVTMRNCTVYGNDEGYPGVDFQGTYGDCSGIDGGTVVSSDLPITMIDCVFWNNWSISYQAINDPIDPLILRTAGTDGDMGNADDDYQLTPDSPASNDGDPAYVAFPGETDVYGNPRVLCGRIDRGAYEYRFDLFDYNCDQSLDLSDHSFWDDCMTGPNAGAYEIGCEAFDAIPADGDIDLQDFAVLQRVGLNH